MCLKKSTKYIILKHSGLRFAQNLKVCIPAACYTCTTDRLILCMKVNLKYANMPTIFIHIYEYSVDLKNYAADCVNYTPKTLHAHPGAHKQAWRRVDRPCLLPFILMFPIWLQTRCSFSFQILKSRCCFSTFPTSFPGASSDKTTLFARARSCF